jgi:hypothetical protein
MNSSKTLLRLLAIIAAGVAIFAAKPALAIVPLVQDYLHGIDALTALAKIPPADQAQYRQDHAEELDAAVRAVESADDIYRYTLAVNAQIIFKYGHAVICNYDEETGPRIGQLIDNHIARLEKENVAPNEARRATGKLKVDELVLGEMLDEFPCPTGPTGSASSK